MPQPFIPLEPNRIYHIWTHANGSENLFRTDENYRYLLEKYAQHIHPIAKSYAYCLMPNHLHLMVEIRGEKELRALQGFGTLGEISLKLSKQFSNLFNAYTQAYNKMYDRKGSLFIPKFRRKLIDNDTYFTRLIAYIHNNPIHHQFVNDLNEWSHSSYNAYLLSSPTKIERKLGLEWFGGKNEFIKIHQELKAKDVMMEFEY
ncbi:transposase [Ekhidna sp.]|uniref:transposase n=1 Tax=Ekhidna sp. TaxID=2608089 RepID=UPI003C79C0CA